MESFPPSASRVPDWSCDTTSHSEEESAMELARIGVDIAKQVFQLHGNDRSERILDQPMPCKIRKANKHPHHRPPFWPRQPCFLLPLLPGILSHSSLAFGPGRSVRHDAERGSSQRNDHPVLLRTKSQRSPVTPESPFQRCPITTNKLAHGRGIQKEYQGPDHKVRNAMTTLPRPPGWGWLGRRSLQKTRSCPASSVVALWAGTRETTLPLTAY